MKHVALLITMTACTNVTSKDVLTDAMRAQIEARGDDGGSTTVTATLVLDDPGDFIELSPGDQLVATTGMRSKPMDETGRLDGASYEATFATNDADTGFEVAFRRTIDPGAPSSTVTLPPPFTITPLFASQSRAEAMTIEWLGVGAGDAIGWRITGSCIDDLGGEVAVDTGALELAADTIHASAGGDEMAETCDATLEITRTRHGRLDPGYGKGGRIDGTQVRAMTFTTMP